MDTSDTKGDDKLRQLVAAIPKVELHIHLEGAIPLTTLLRLVQRKGTEPSIRTLDDLRHKLHYVDFPHFIELWTWKNTFIATEADFEEITYDVLHDLHDQNVKYVELTYAPGDYWPQGLAIEAITENIIEAKQRAFADCGIRSGLIVDLIRDHGPEVGLERVRALSPYRDRGLVGITIGGSEQTFPPDPYEHVYRAAADCGFRLTAHAGEAAGAESIWAAVNKLNVERIGHGTRAYEDPELVSLLAERRIPLEMCVLSNVRTRVCPSVEEHPIRVYFDQGLLITVNSDDPTMFNTSINQEYLTLIRDLDFSPADVKRISLNAVDAAFLPEAEKGRLRSTFQTEWESLAG